MSIELKIPAVGESITEVQISEWLKSEGDNVNQDESVAVVDSEKTTFELPAPATGRLTKIIHQAGEMVPVGAVVAELDSDGEAGEKGAAKAATKGRSDAAPKAGASSKDNDSASSPAGQKGKSKSGKTEPAAALKAKPAPTSQAEAKTARQDRPTLPKTSHQSEENFRMPTAPKPSYSASVQPSGDREEEVVPMTMLRRTVARRLVEARQTMAMLTTFNEVDVSAVQALRKQHGEAFEKRYQVRLGLMSFFVKAAIDALKQFPKINAEIRDASIIYRNYFDIAVALATERGLVVPVLRGAERLSFAEVEKSIGDFARRARGGGLQPEELEGGTFTITNGGVFGSLLSTPIINPPQSGILGMHTIQERPVALNGQVVIRPMMYLALTYDHRLVDGREAVLFLRRIKEAIENPTRMLIEI